MWPEAASSRSADAGQFPDVEAQRKVLVRGAVDVIPDEDLTRKLERSRDERRPLRVKLGLDPTAQHVTLGWAVVLRKLRDFQDMGHTAVLIVGDFTARVGDPSGKSETRPRLEKDVVRGHAERLLGQFEKILMSERLEVRYNSEWLEAMDMEEVLRLTAAYTVARMLERDDFAKRFAERRPISIMEFLYPLLQAKDSVEVGADIELGGTDQKFNLLLGREIQRDFGQEPQAIVTMPLLEGLDGVQKMSQSLGNYVGITEPPEEMFGKLMRIPDDLIGRYFELCTGRSEGDIAEIKSALATGSENPNLLKRALAREVVAIYHGPAAAAAAEADFNVVHRDRRIPDDVREVRLPADLEAESSVWLPRLVAVLGLAASNAEAARLVAQGGIRIDGEKFTDPKAEIPLEDIRGRVVQKGRREFVRILAG